MALSNPTHPRTHGGDWYFQWDSPAGVLHERWPVGAGGGTAAEWLAARSTALQAALEQMEIDGAVGQVEGGRLGLEVCQNPVHLTTNAGGINHAMAARLIRWMMRLGKSNRPVEQWQAIFALAMLESLIDHIESQGWTNQQIADALEITTTNLAALNARVNKLRNVDTVNSPLDAARNYLLDAEDWA